LTAVTSALRRVGLHESAYAQPAPGEREAGVFNADPYYYPPQFMLTAASLTHLIGTDDFVALRRMWFAGEVLLFMIALCVIGSYIAGRTGLIVVLLMPVVWLAPPVLLNLQIENAQIATIAAAIAGMALLSSGRLALGGCLVASAIAAKIFPVVLVVGLLVRGQWRQVAAVAAWLIVFTAAAVAAYGAQPFRDFASIFPSVSNGTVPYTTALIGDPNLAVANLSSYGFTRKLVGLHVLPSLNHDALYQAAFSALVLIVVLAASVTRRVQDDQQVRLTRIVEWLAVMNLASFRSPFLPDAYGPVGTYCLGAVLVAALARPTWRHVFVITMAWVSLAPIAGVETLAFLPIRVALASTLFVQIGVFLLNIVSALAEPLGLLVNAQTGRRDQRAVAAG
jgi:hypothetical protein